MFIGEFEYRVDEKGRVPIPPKFRNELKEAGVVLSPGMEKCITIYPLSEWKKLSDSLTSSSVAASKLRKLYRAFFASSFSIEIDGQGRISVPAQLRQHCAISDEVIIAGANTYLELWSKEKWAEEKADSLAEAWQIIESLEKR
jgi:MraZ protein